MSDFDFDELDKAVTSALGTQASVSSDDGQSAAPLSDDERAAVATGSRGSNIAVPSRSSTASTALHSRTMQSHRVAREQSEPVPTEQPVLDTTPPIEEPEVVGDFSAINDAVNSIVNDTHATEPTAFGGDLSQESDLSSKTPDDTASEDNTPTKLNLPSRRSGRFMDVVHPSSDMKTSSMSTTMGARKSPVVAPLSFDENADAADSNENKTLTEPNEAISNGDIALQNGMNPDDVPAPIDLETSASQPINTELSSQISSLLGEEPAAPEPVVTPPETPQPEEATEQPTSLADDNQTSDVDSGDMDGLDFEETPEQGKAAAEPLSSPFLEGVTVEKRPLGDAATAGSEKEETPSPVEESKAAGYKEELKHPDDAMDAEVLPDELSDNLVSIEATDTSESPAPAPVASSENTSQTSQLKKSFAKEAAATGPTSIAKQYKEKPRTDDTEASGDIFDTKNYHKPIKDDDTKKSLSPLVLISLVVGIIICVAAGVFFAWWSGILSL